MCVCIQRYVCFITYRDKITVYILFSLRVTTLIYLLFRGATINLGPDVPDPGLVDDGSPCYTNTKTKSQGICINKKCVDINTITIPSCPVDVNGTICFGNGVYFFNLNN